MSITVPDCYDNIIGLTRSECECYSNFPDDSDTSFSGLYLDELVGLSFVQSMTNCDNGDDLFTNMEKARANAITSFQADTNALLLQNFRLNRNPYKGGIGRAQVTNNLTVTTGNYMGVRLYCDTVKSGTLTIKSIGTIFDANGTIDLTIYNNLNETIGTYTLNTVANTHTANAVDIELPLYNENSDHMEYFLLYQVGATPKPLGNDIKCSCGRFKPKFDCNHPYFHDTHETTYGWADWLMIGGMNKSTLPDFDDCECSTTNLLYGLTLIVELRCNINETLCLDSMDFEGNPLAAAMAISILNKAGYNFGSWILASGNLNRFNMINTEQLATDMKVWNDTYVQMINYIAQSADITQNDCFACKDIYEMAKRGIFS